jgi:hypothetical protein
MVAFPFLPNHSVASTVFEAYNVRTWEDVIPKSFREAHLLELVLCLSQFVDKRTSITEIKNRSRQLRTFVCTCGSWKCQFQRSNALVKEKIDKWSLKAIPLPHAHGCPQTTEIIHALVLRNSQQFAALLVNKGSDYSKEDVCKSFFASGIGIRNVAPSTFYKLRRYHIYLQRARVVFQYWQLAQFLRKLCQQNVGTTAALQLDDHGCFYRLFLSFGSAPRLFGKVTLSIIFVDCAASKSLFFDGVHAFFSAKDGNGNTFPLALAIIPCESVVHMAWCVQMMQKSGFDVENNPFFSDRGHLIAAAASLAHSGGPILLKSRVMPLCLMLCLILVHWSAI